MNQPELFPTGPEPRLVDSWREIDRKVLEVFVTERGEPMDPMPDTLVVAMVQQSDKETPGTIIHASLGWLIHYRFITADSNDRLSITTKGLEALGLGESQ